MSPLLLIFAQAPSATPTVPVDVIEMLRLGLIGLAGLTIVLGWVLYYILLKEADAKSIPARAKAIASYQRWSYGVFGLFVLVELLKYFIAPATPRTSTVSAKI